MMKKLFTFFLALAASVGMMNADPTIFANFTATAGSGGFSGEDYSKLVDGKFISSDWSKWCANAGHKSVPTGESESCWWLDFQASTAINITGYILTTGNDSGTESGRNPKNWVIKAKLNASDAWTTIATVTDDDVMENANFKDFAFYLDQPGTYQYFRFEILANQGANVMQLCELRLTYSTEPAPTKYTVALKEGTANADKVTLSATSVLAGKTITVTPVEGYEITAFAAKYNTTEEAAATLTPKTGAYSFTMPAANVTIEATIAEKAAPDPENPKAVDSGTKGGMSYTFYDTGLLEISGSGALPGRAFTNWDDGFGASVKNIRFAEDCEVYGLDYMWFACYTEKSQLETVEIKSVVPIMFTGVSGAGISYKQDGAVTLTITAPAIVDIENSIIHNYGSPVNMIFNMPATTVFEKKWFSGLDNYFAVTIPTGAKGHIPGGYSFTNPYDQQDYDNFVEMGHEADFWKYNGDRLTEGVDYTLGVESTFVITAENASQIFGQATVSFKAPTEAGNSEWVFWRKSDLKEFPDMSSGDQKVCKDVTVKVNNGVYNTDSGWGIHFESSAEDGVQFVAPEGKVFKRIVILNEYGTFSDPNWSYDGNYKRWSGSANTVGFVGNICGISLIEFELGDPEPVQPDWLKDGDEWDAETKTLTVNSSPGVSAYASQSEIEHLIVGDDVISVGNYAFQYCSNLASVTFGSSIVQVCNNSFDGTALTSIEMPDNIRRIGYMAFNDCVDLVTVTVGTDMANIDGSAFKNCSKLVSLTCKAVTPPNLSTGVFTGASSLAHIYVPAESVDAYKGANKWKDYASIIEAIPGGDDPEPVAEYAEIIFIEPIAAADLAADATFGLLGTDFSVAITDTDNKLSIDANSCRFGGEEDYKSYSHRLKTGGKSSSKNFITLNIPAAGKIRIAVRTGSNSATDRNLVITQGEKELYNAVVQESQATKVIEGDNEVSVYPYVEVAVAAGTVLVTYPVGSLNFYSFGFMEDSTATGVDEIANGKSQTIKVIRDGQLLIIRDGKIYNVMGTVVR